MKSDDLLLGLLFSTMAGVLAYLLLAPYEQYPAAAPNISRDAPAAPVAVLPAPPPPQVEMPRLATRPLDRRVDVDDSLVSARRDIAVLRAAGEFLAARALLVERAAAAHADGDATSLGYLLALLGEVAMDDRDFAGSAVFLEESIDIFRDNGDRVGEAYALMQLARTNIESRAIARRASHAYNLLLLARNQLHEYRHQAAEANLREAVSASLDIERYGTAASALETLARLKRDTGSTLEAEEALFQAAELYAACGQADRSESILDALAKQGVDQSRLSIHRAEVAEAHARFESDTLYVKRADDYRRLYHHYRNTGDHERAWQLRTQAAAMLSQTSKRAMYYRQPDVIALLYESNLALSRAESLTALASTMFRNEGAEELAQQANDLARLIF